MSKRIDLTGKTFNTLKVIEFAYKKTPMPIGKLSVINVVSLKYQVQATLKMA